MNVETRRHSPSTPWTYELLDRRQRELAREVRLGKPGAILLSEVAPVITLGRRTPASDVLFDPGFLKERGVEILQADRGGFATYHGPGQWVLFVVDRLELLTGDPRGVKIAVKKLLDVALEVAGSYVSEPTCRSGAELGAWSAAGKFAAVGVHVEQGVLLHGLSVNGFQTETSFLGLRPCGLDAPVDYLLKAAATLERGAAFEELGAKLGDSAVRHFGAAGR